MHLNVNGQEQEVAGETTLEAFLATLGVNRAAVVVERNGQVVERCHHVTVSLEAGDRLEIVHFIGGA